MWYLLYGQGLTTVVTLEINFKVSSLGHGPQVVLSDFDVFLVTEL